MTNKHAKKYNNIKLGIGIGKGVFSFFAIIAFVYFGFSKELENYLSVYSENKYFILLLFLFVIGTASSVVSFPIKYYVEFYLEHKYELSNQSIWKWLLEDFKGFLVNIEINVLKTVDLLLSTRNLFDMCSADNIEFFICARSLCFQ